MPPNGSQIPDKLYFKIGEVAAIVGVKPYVLRYWENEFSAIRPGKSGSKHRLYRKRDVETLLEIEHLQRSKGYTIEGAKKHLRGSARSAGRQSRGSIALGARTYRDALIRLKRELESLYDLLG